MSSAIESFAIRFTQVFFSLLPTFPQVPLEFSLPITNFINLVDGNGGRLLGLFVHIPLLQIIVSLYLAVIVIDIVIKVLTWLLHKLPINVS